MVIGLYGGWGTGKTSLMRQIQAALNPNTTRSIWFDPWKHQFDEAPALSLLHTLVDTFGIESEARKYLTIIGSAFASIFLKQTTSLSLSDVDAIAKRYEDERFLIREARVRLSQYFETVISKAKGGDNRRLIFFIDDLDRCMPRQVLDLLEAIKLYLNVTDCVYFLGVDRSALERSIKHCYADLDLSETSYLDKIVQLPFSIPPIPLGSMTSFIETIIPPALRWCVGLLAEGLGDNPREVKRFINTLVLNDQLGSMLRIPEYDPRNLAILLLIQSRSPTFYRAIVRNPEILTGLSPTDETWQSFVAPDDRLAKTLQIFRPAKDIGRYIYLTQVAGVSRVHPTEPRVYAGLDEQLQRQLGLHEAWVESGGVRGQRLVRSDVNVSRRELQNALLAQAILDDGDFQYTNLRGANLDGARFRNANLRFGILRSASAVGADFQAANFEGADIRGVDFSGANLSRVKNLRAQDLSKAITDSHTLLPNGSGGPFIIGTGAHRPKARATR
jgi:hypothetical protein